MFLLNHRIYKLTNTVTGEIYIGETSLTLEERWSAHLKVARSGRDNSIGRSIRTYGEESFSMELIEMCYKDDAVDIEEKWIAHYDSYHNGLNDAPRKYVSSLGYKFSEERKREYSKMFSGSRNPMYGRDVRDYMSEEKQREWRENMSKSRKGMKFTDAHRKALSENSGKKKAVVKIDEQGNIIETYPSLTAAYEENSPSMAFSTFTVRIKKGSKVEGFTYRHVN